jgi:hypothetical protein
MAHHDHTYSSNCPDGSGTAEFEKAGGKWNLKGDYCGKGHQTPDMSQFDQGNNYQNGDVVRVCCVASSSGSSSS